MAVVPAQPLSSPAWRATQFAVYVGLWTASAICVRWEGTQARVHANPLVMALAIEFTKLTFSAVMLVYQEGLDGMLAAVQGVPRAVWLKWAVPAALYVVYNRLMFLVLGVYFQPAVYRLLTQQQIVWTAVLCYVILAQRLNKRQLCAVALLTVGVCLVYVDELKTWSAGTSMLGPLVASVSQTMCSAFAGVYIEALLRSDQKSSIHLTNLVLYVWTCTLLCLWVWWQRPPGSLLSSLYEGSSLASHLAIAFSAMAGIATSTFLRYLGAMWKEFARSTEIITIAVTAYLFLHDKINPNLLWAFPLIMFANLQYNGYLPQWCAFALFKEDEPKEASKDGAV